jgi:hypothetical protein
MRSRKVRRYGSIFGSILALAFVVAAFAPGAAQGGLAFGKNVRWDLVNLVPAGSPNTAVAGGTNVGLDASGETVEVTGSGNAVPALRDATGGGTFVHRDATGAILAQGFYRVTGFVSWHRRAGTFPSFLTDGIMHASQASAGLLTLNIQAFPDGGPTQGIPAVLTIHCHFPDTPGPGDEGIDLAVPSFGLHFMQAGGVTVFHVFR